MHGWRWSARPVQIVGDLLESPSGEIALEDFNDDGRLLGVGLKAGLVIPGASASGVGVRLAAQPVAVGCSAAVAVALPRVLSLPAPDFTAQLLDLKLIERLKHMTHEPSLGARLVPGGDGVVDLYARACKLPLERECVKEVAGQP
jgi:hypothetical protein